MIPGYGFVDEDTPELTLVVVPTKQGQGIGRAAARRAARAGEARGATTRSRCRCTAATAETGELPRRSGFEQVHEDGDTLTLRRPLVIHGRSSVDERRVDRVVDRRLAVEHLGARRLELRDRACGRARPGSPGRRCRARSRSAGTAAGPSSQPSTVGDEARRRRSPPTAAGGRSPSPTARLITAPCEKPPSTTLSYGSESTNPDSAAKPSAKVAGSG